MKKQTTRPPTPVPEDHDWLAMTDSEIEELIRNPPAWMKDRMISPEQKQRIIDEAVRKFIEKTTD